jgi:hypothetical protein
MEDKEDKKEDENVEDKEDIIEKGDENSENKEDKNIENKENITEKEKGDENSENQEENSKKELDEQSRLLKSIFIGIGMLIVFLIIIFLIISYQTSFEYNGAVFKKIREGELILYNIQIPVSSQGKIIPYNFYLRNNPEKLEKDVSFEGELGEKVLLKNVVINMSEEISCKYELIAIANLLKLYQLLGANVVKNESISCDKQEEKYMYLNIQEAENTSIVQYGPACYELNFNNCEILEVTERFMIETFAEVKEIKNY